MDWKRYFTDDLNVVFLRGNQNNLSNIDSFHCVEQMTATTKSVWIEKLKTAKKAGLLQNGMILFYFSWL